MTMAAYLASVEALATWNARGEGTVTLDELIHKLQGLVTLDPECSSTGELPVYLLTENIEVYEIAEIDLGTTEDPTKKIVVVRLLEVETWE